MSNKKSRIQIIASEKGVMLRDLANFLDITPSQMSKVGKLGYDVTVDRYKKIAEYLGCSYLDLLELEEGQQYVKDKDGNVTGIIESKILNSNE
tara:strand:- start:43 stop:321 length:279 start_codon:yes stop_codon:yes gene_type:complete